MDQKRTDILWAFAGVLLLPVIVPTSLIMVAYYHAAKYGLIGGVPTTAATRWYASAAWHRVLVWTFLAATWWTWWTTPTGNESGIGALVVFVALGWWWHATRQFFRRQRLGISTFNATWPTKWLGIQNTATPPRDRTGALAQLPTDHQWHMFRDDIATPKHPPMSLRDKSLRPTEDDWTAFERSLRPPDATA